MPFDPKRPHKQPSDFQNTSAQVDSYAVAPKVSQPFQPRLIHPDPAPADNEGELQLPDDLAALAEQLQNDVAYLSNCYPPAAPSKAAPLPGATAVASSSVRMRITVLTTAAAAVAVALSIALFANRLQLAEHAERRIQPATSDRSALDRQQSIVSEGAEQGTAFESLVPESASQDALSQSESLLLLGEATGPEREGLLDLLQQTASTETGISF